MTRQQVAAKMVSEGFAYRLIERRTGLQYWKVCKIARENGGVGRYRRGETTTALDRVLALIKQIRESK